MDAQQSLPPRVLETLESVPWLRRGPPEGHITLPQCRRVRRARMLLQTAPRTHQATRLPTLAMLAGDDRTKASAPSRHRRKTTLRIRVRMRIPTARRQAISIEAIRTPTGIPEATSIAETKAGSTSPVRHSLSTNRPRRVRLRSTRLPHRVPLHNIQARLRSIRTLRPSTRVRRPSTRLPSHITAGDRRA